MKYNLCRIWGFSILMSILLATAVSTVCAQNILEASCEQKKADKLLEQGNAAYDKKAYPEALSFYDQAVKAAPKCSVPFFKKALVLLDTRKQEEAVAALQESLKRNFNEPFRIYYGICQARFEQDRYEEAAKNCQQSMRLNDNFFWAAHYLAMSYYELKDFEKALAAESRAVELDPKYSYAHQLKGAILLELKRFNEALPELNEAIKLDPNNAPALFGLGFAYFNLKNYALAVENLTRAVELDPDFFGAWAVLASAHIGNSTNWQKSEEAAAQAVRLNPEDGNANFLLGLTQMVNGKLEASIRSFDTAIKNKNLLPASSAVYKGFALIGLRRADEAEKSFARAFTFKPTNKADYSALTEVYYYHWDLEKAREEIKKAINFASDDNDAQEYTFLSWNYSLSGDPQQAVIAANEAIVLDPKDSDGYTSRCRAFNETKLPDAAIKDCLKSLEIRPNDGEVLFYLGNSYGLKNDAAEEKDYNRKAITFMEQRLGTAFQQQANGKVAIVQIPPQTDRGKVSLNSPAYSYYLYLLGNAYFKDGRFDSAIAAYEKVLELRPRFPRLRFNLAASYLNLKRPDVKSAEAQYNELVLIDQKLAADLKKILNGYRRKK